MKLKRILKIILLISCFLVTSLMIVGVYSVIIAGNSPLDYDMYINILLCLAGVISIVYHFKTLKFYKETALKKIMIEVSLWVSNLIFALLLIYLSLKSVYTFYNFNLEGTIDSDLYIMYLFCLFFLLLGVCLVFEESVLYKRIIEIKNQSRKDSIDDIKGVKDNPE